MLLSDHVFIQTRLDLVRCRNLMNIQYRLFPVLRLLLFEPLLIRNSSLALQIIDIDKADIGEPLSHGLVQIVHHGRIIQHSHIVKLADRIHGLVHTVTAHRNIIRKLEHLARLALRTAADKTDILIFAFLLRISRVVLVRSSFCLCFGYRSSFLLF